MVKVIPNFSTEYFFYYYSRDSLACSNTEGRTITTSLTRGKLFPRQRGGSATGKTSSECLIVFAVQVQRLVPSKHVRLGYDCSDTT
jgi:hypothetical protein